MVSRSLVRRGILLAVWLGAVVALLDVKEPGFWREIVASTGLGGRGADAPAADTAGERVAQGPQARIETPPAPEAVEAAPRAADRAAGEAPRGVLEEGPSPAAPAAASTSAGAIAAAGEPSAPALARVAATAHASPPRRRGEGLRSARTAGDPWTQVGEVWRLDAEGRYVEAWALAEALPASRHPEILRVRALTAVWAQRPEADALVRTWLERDPQSVEGRLALAQARLQEGGMDEARSLLAGLAADARPTAAQRMQLAALQEWAAEPQAAIASYREVLATRPDDLDALRSLCRVSESIGDDQTAAAAAERGLALAPDDPTLRLLAARLAAERGQRDVATARYDAYVAAHPDDLDGRLEAARFAVNAGTPEVAVARYRAVADARGLDGMRVELARALLAAGRDAEAEEVARDAIAHGEDGPEARLALAQSVALQGRTREATGLFQDAARMGAERGLGSAWDARIALAGDRHLEAYGLLGDALDELDASSPDRAATAAQLWLDRGAAAEKRGDVARARAAYETAGQLGARLQSDVALSRLASGTRPEIEAAYVHFSDANGFDVDGGVVRAEAWIDARLRLTAQTIAQVVSQGDARFTRTGGHVGFADLFALPELSLSGEIGFENSSAGGGNLVVGDLAAKRFFEDGSAAGLRAYRQSLLSGHEDLDPRLFNRIIDLGALGPSFAVNGARAWLDEALRRDVRDRVWVEGGVENYQDGNLRGFAYGHYQVPVRQARGDWAVIRPNAFVEAFKRPDQPNYFSPTTHATVGVAAHTVQEWRRVRVEAELNPQMLVTNGDVGYGAYGLLDVGVEVGRGTTIGASGFAFYDSVDDYWLARAMARIEVVLP